MVKDNAFSPAGNKADVCFRHFYSALQWKSKIEAEGAHWKGWSKAVSRGHEHLHKKPSQIHKKAPGTSEFGKVTDIRSIHKNQLYHNATNSWKKN